MSKVSAKLAKFFSSPVFVIFLLIFIVLFVIDAVYSTKSDNQAKRSINAAISEIKLPASYRLVSSKYDSQGCLDVCAHTTLVYKLPDGMAPNITTLDTELNNLGYKRDDNYHYNKAYFNKLIHVHLTDTKQGEFSMDVSL